MCAELFAEIRAFQKFDMRAVGFRTQSRQVVRTACSAPQLDNRNTVCIVRNPIQVSFVSTALLRAGHGGKTKHWMESEASQCTRAYFRRT